MNMFPHTVTILNKVESDDGVVYLPTELKGVLYVNSNSTSKSLTGLSDDTKIKCTIPMRIDVNKPFIDSLAYNKLSLSDKSSYWTLNKEDIIVLGVVSEDMVSLKDINNTFNDKLVISWINSYNFGSLRHWQVGGA